MLWFIFGLGVLVGMLIVLIGNIIYDHGVDAGKKMIKPQGDGK